MCNLSFCFLAFVFWYPQLRKGWTESIGGLSRRMDKVYGEIPGRYAYFHSKVSTWNVKFQNSRLRLLQFERYSNILLNEGKGSQKTTKIWNLAVIKMGPKKPFSWLGPKKAPKPLLLIGPKFLGPWSQFMHCTKLKQKICDIAGDVSLPNNPTATGKTNNLPTIEELREMSTGQNTCVTSVSFVIEPSSEEVFQSAECNVLFCAKHLEGLKEPPRVPYTDKTNEDR